MAQKNKYATFANPSKLMEDSINMKYAADVLPSVLKDEYDRTRDTSIDKEIAKKSNQVMGGAIEGLNKYKDISDPFARRALAEKYQSGLSIGLSNLLTEKERRQKSFTEYVSKWTGFYGAEAARRQSLAEEARRNETKGTGEKSKYNASLNAIADDVRMGKFNRETAKAMLLREYPDANPNDIYTVVQDNYDNPKVTGEKSKYDARLSAIADDVRTGKYDRETAKDTLLREYPDANPNDIYTVVKDNYEKRGELDDIRARINRLRMSGYSEKEIKEELYMRGFGNYSKNFFED